MAAESVAFSEWAAQFGFSGYGVPVFMGWFSTTFLKIVVDVMTLGLPQVCKPLFGVSKGMLPVRHLALTILMAVNYCRCLLARLLELVTPAYHNKEGGTLHPGVCMHGFQYDGRPDGRFLMWVGTWNLGSLSGKGEEVCK